jgi:glutamyl-tRNA synthetase/nondiscriminating glutamyl-tRNA synthetase
VNYLALIGWSPGQNEELLPAPSSRGVSVSRTSRTARVCSTRTSCAWANRHYLKLCTPDRLAALAEPYLRARGQIVDALSVATSEWLEHVLPGMAQSVDRLPQLADRLDTVFRFEVPSEPLDAGLVTALAEELAAAPRLTDKEAFRALANRVKDRTGLKGKNLFHPIRVILTGAHEGPELDLIVPAIDRAIDVAGLAPVMGCRERAAAFAARL